MNARRVTTAIGCAAAVIAAGIGLTASMASAETTPPVSALQPMTFTEHYVSFKSFNLGPSKGPAVGYTEISAADLMQGGVKVGHDGSSCVMTRAGAKTSEMLCTVTSVLAQGQVVAQGLVTSNNKSGPGTFELAIIGGTGAYQGAAGVATIVPSRNPTVTLTFQ